MRNEKGQFVKGHKENVGFKHSFKTIERMKNSENKGRFKKGHVAYNKGKLSPLRGVPRTQELKNKVSEAMKGKPSWIKGKTFEEVYGEEKAKTMKAKLSKKAIKQFTGIRLSKEQCENIAKGHIGKVLSQESKDKISKSHTGKELSEETRSKLRKMSSFYIDGRTPLRGSILSCQEAKDWKSSILKRDSYSCCLCNHRNASGKRKDLHVHHKIRFSILLTNFLNEYNQFSPNEDKEILIRLAYNHKPFWDINNGVTLCEDCHKKLHGDKKWEKEVEQKLDHCLPGMLENF